MLAAEKAGSNESNFSFSHGTTDMLGLCLDCLFAFAHLGVYILLARNSACREW